MLTFLAWLLLFFLCWPLALLALVAYPIVWLLLLPLRLLGMAIEGVLRLPPRPPSSLRPACSARAGT